MFGSVPSPPATTSGPVRMFSPARLKRVMRPPIAGSTTSSMSPMRNT
jgi:hypothetical protein